MRLIQEKFAQYHNAVYIIMAGLVIRIFASIFIMPGFDEAYYAVYSFHPALGFFDHPPFVAFSAGFGLWFTSIYNPLTLRIGALLLFSITAFLVYLIAREIYGEKAGILSLVFLHLTPYFMFGMGAFVIPDNGLGLFWVLFLYSLLKIDKSGDGRWFLLSGAAFGFAMLSKYHAVFLPGGLFLLLLLYPQWRRYFKSPWLYTGFLLGIVIFLPNLLWNEQNNWITFTTQFGKSASGGLNISFSKFIQGILVQAAYLLPWLMYVYIKVSFMATPSKKDPGSWLVPFIFPVIIAFTLIGATRQILPHWPMPGYLGAIIISGSWFAGLTTKRLKIFINTTLITSVILIGFILVQSITGLVPINRHGDLTLDGQGWSDVISTLEKEKHLNPNQDFLIGHKWFTGGEMAFAGANRYPVAVFNHHSPHGFAYWIKQKRLKGKTGFFITSERYHFDPHKALLSYFTSISPADTIITYRVSGKEAQRFYVYTCTNYNGEYKFAYGPQSDD